MDNHERGVGPHPHRGFETVTLAFEGSVAHHDSSGNEGVIRPGDVQWMTTLALVMQGAIEVQGQTANALDLVLFENAGEAITLRATQNAQVLLLSGEPIAEPVVQYGPFVMNTQAEIRAAMVDFNAGKFGVLAD